MLGGENVNYGQFFHAFYMLCSDNCGSIIL